MVSNQEPLSKAAKKAIDGVLNERLKAFGYEGAEISLGDDYDGDPVIFIDARYRLSDRPIEPDVTLFTLVALRKRLLELGERRFPHLRHHFHEKQKVKGFA